MTDTAPPTAPASRKIRWLFVTSSLLFAAGLLFTPDYMRFRVFHDESSFNSVMSRQSSPTIAEIQSLLGSGVALAEEQRHKLIAATRDFSQQTPESYPDGVTKDDQFLAYDLGSHTSYIQFRDGAIVNFNPREYDANFELSAIR